MPERPRVAETLAALYAWLGGRLHRSGLHWLPTTVVLLALIAASSTHFHVRPHIASLVAFAITCATLVAFEAGRVGLRGLAGLVPLFVLWANWHGAMLGGWATVVLAAAGWGVVGLLGRGSPIDSIRRAGGVGLVVAGCGLAALANPYGVRLPATWLAIMGSSALPRLIVEHARPGPRSVEFWAILVLGLGYAAVLAGTLPRWPRVTWLLPVVWFALALSRVRHAPLFGIAAAVALADVLPYSRVASWLARPARDLFRFAGPGQEVSARPDWRPWALPAAVVGLAVVLQAANVRVPVLGRGWAGLDPTAWPVELLPALRQAERDHPAGARIFNDYEFGGFLIYHTPALKVFIDDRWEVYGDAWVEQFDHARTVEPARVDGWLDEYRVDYALVATGSAFDRQIAARPGWSPIARCPTAAFYGRRPATLARDIRAE